MNEALGFYPKREGLIPSGSANWLSSPTEEAVGLDPIQ